MSLLGVLHRLPTFITWRLTETMGMFRLQFLHIFVLGRVTSWEWVKVGTGDLGMVVVTVVTVTSKRHEGQNLTPFLFFFLCMNSAVCQWKQTQQLMSPLIVDIHILFVICCTQPKKQ